MQMTEHSIGRVTSATEWYTAASSVKRRSLAIVSTPVSVPGQQSRVCLAVKDGVAHAAPSVSGAAGEVATTHVSRKRRFRQSPQTNEMQVL